MPFAPLSPATASASSNRRACSSLSPSSPATSASANRASATPGRCPTSRRRSADSCWRTSPQQVVVLVLVDKVICRAIYDSRSRSPTLVAAPRPAADRTATFAVLMQDLVVDLDPKYEQPRLARARRRPGDTTPAPARTSAARPGPPGLGPQIPACRSRPETGEGRLPRCPAAVRPSYGVVVAIEHRSFVERRGVVESLIVRHETQPTRIAECGKACVCGSPAKPSKPPPAPAIRTESSACEDPGVPQIRRIGQGYQPKFGQSPADGQQCLLTVVENP